MTYNSEFFIQDFAKALDQEAAAVFVGAGLSQGAGYPGWGAFVTDLARRLDLPPSDDLVALAQFAVNQDQGRNMVNKRVVEEFTRERAYTDVHLQLARLPLKTYWTTNYDALLEDAIRESKGLPEVKKTQEDLARHIPDRVATIFKMHGDAESPQEAVLIRDDYEDYARTKELFVDVLTADLLMKTFVFLGVSFTDPNLMFLLGRLRSIYNGARKEHFWITKRPAADDPSALLFDLRVSDLKRYGIRTIVLNSHSELGPLLEEINQAYVRFRRRNTVFFSGSIRDSDVRAESLREFTEQLAVHMALTGRTIITGLGRGIGGWVTSAALNALYKKSEYAIRADKVIARPFPIGSATDSTIRRKHRERMLSEAGFAIFISGKDDDASGTKEEYAIARDVGCHVLPIGATGGQSALLWEKTCSDLDAVFGSHRKAAESLFVSLGDPLVPLHQHVDTVANIISKVQAG